MSEIIDLLRQVRDLQREPFPEIEGENADAYQDRLLAHLNEVNEWVAVLYYKGNSVGWSHSKSENYGKALLTAWDELKKLGVPCDGNTSVAQAIAKFCVKRADA
jgi:hypothetical protein